MQMRLRTHAAVIRWPRSCSTDSVSGPQRRQSQIREGKMRFKGTLSGGFDRARGRRLRPNGERPGNAGGAGHDQDRRAAFAVGHDGDQRDDAEGHRPDDGRRHQQEGRAARQEGRGGGRRSGLELAALRREGARAARQGQGRGGVRLLDLGVAQIGAAGVRGAERPAVLSGAVRGRGELEQRLLHRRRAEPAGDPGGRVPDERGRRRRSSAGCSKAPTTSIRAPPTRSSKPS